ncbi:MAG: phage tail protein I [Gammaproteobacteria bacterium]|nr:phage tail protein I [Gammaproteobacteria bacterium]
MPERSLLPHSAAPLEHAVAKACAFDIPVVTASLWNAASCPAPLLPYLAQALSVDFWDNAWPEPVKRQVIADSPAWHAIKGTPGAIEQGLASLGHDATVREWFEYGGARGYFRVEVDLTGNPGTWSTAMALHIIGVAQRLSQHLESLRLRATHRGTLGLGACAAVRLKTTVYPRSVRRATHDAQLKLACAAGTRIRTTVYPKVI